MYGAKPTLRQMPSGRVKKNLLCFYCIFR